MEQTIIEDSRLIAEYIGGRQEEHGDYEMYGIIESIDDGPDEKHFFLPSEMLFLSSWDWLMPVVEKIENVLNGEVSVIISEASCGINYCAIYSVSVESNTKIEAIWLACVNFIAWYNLQHNKL